MPTSTFQRALFLLVLVIITGSLNAQTTTTTKKRPNLPGSIIVDLGLNGTQGAPELWKQTVFGARTVNLYYQYPLRFGRSQFSFNPAIGFSFERFKWKNSVILNDPTEAGGANNQIEKYEFDYANSRFGTGFDQKIMFVQNYLEIPLEIRFDTKPEDISRSFNVAVGVRGGWLYDSFVKVKYKEDGQTKKTKDKQDWGLTQFRYGVYTRIGMGGFNLFCFYNLTPLFQKDMGPYNLGAASDGAITGGATGTTMTTFTAGISLNAF